MSKIRSLGTRTLFIVGSGVAISVCAYSAYRYWKLSVAKSIDEGFEDVSRNEEKKPDLRILVLGLENAGKSTVIAQLLGLSANTYGTPTEGSMVVMAKINNKTYSIWEVGGGERYRASWVNFVQDTNLLMFVVDSTDTKRFALASRELKNILGDERLHGVPLMVVANKQDLPNATEPIRLFDMLDLSTVCNRHHTSCVPMRTLPGSQNTHSDLEKIKSTLSDMVTHFC